MLIKLQCAVSLLTSSCMVCLAASPASIGFVVTSGQAQVDGTAVRSNSTLFQGSLVEAGAAASDLILPGGANLLLHPGSTARVYRDYAVLENGAETQHGNKAYVLADGLRVSSLSPLGAVVVDILDKSHLEVSAQGSAADVRNPAGILLARVEPGEARHLAIQVATQDAPGQTAPAQAQPQGSGAAPVQTPAAPGAQLTLHGIVRKDHAGRYGHYLLTDLATNVTYELQGSGLDDLVGGSVEVTGSIFDTPAAEGASKVLSVSDIHQMPLSEINGGNTAATSTTGVPTPSGDTVPSSTEGPEVGATPEAKAPAEADNQPTAPPPLPVHSDTGKIIIIVALAAGAGVGVALGLAGGKSSTVSPE